MALTQIKSLGIANSAVTSQQLAAGAAGPKITQIEITNSGGTVLDDTAVSTSGGYIKITGTGFASGVVVIVGSVNATATTFTSSTVLNVQVPAQAAGTYTVYVVNTDGGVAIAVNGLTYSGTPTWVTGSSLPNGTTGSAISIQLSATGDTPITYALAAGSTLPTGLSLTSGGLLSGTVTVGAQTTYSFDINAIDAQAQDSPRTFTITIVVGDPYFYLTTMLLPGNGTNNGTNNTFLDSSTNNFTVTRFGNTTQGTFTPFSLTGWSNYFDGTTGQFLSTVSNTAFNFGTGNFTIEVWVYPTGTNASAPMPIFEVRSSSTSTAGFAFMRVANSLNLNVYQNGYLTASTTPLTANTWNHVALVRNGNTWTYFINGTSAGSFTNTSNLTDGATNGPKLGGSSTSGEVWIGYMSNYRITKGGALYTSNFTPSTTPLTTTVSSGTVSLLTCQSNRFIDNSVNNFAITINGTPSIQSFSPFAPGSSYSAGTVGGSAYLDGTGDYLTIADNTALDMGSSNFTIEGWYYPNGNTTNYPALFSKRADGTVVGGVLVYFAQTPTLLPSLLVDIGGAWAINTQSSIPFIAYQWNHFAVVRNGSAFNLYINGVSGVSATNAGSIPDNASAFTIGAMGANGATPLNSCYISNFRIVKGTAVYTTTFTPPTTPVTAIANTSLLCNFTNGQITDATSKNDLETVGDTKISTTQSKWGGSSIYFDGTGDQLSMRNYPSNYISGNENFTIEGWIYPTTSGSSYNSIYCNGYPIQVYYKSNNIECYCSTTNAAPYFINGIIGPAASVATNTWSHFAFVRNGSTFTVYVNGVAGTSSTSSTSIGLTSATNSEIGNFLSVGAYGLTGYLNDLRITKGYARYTTNFTPPTGAFQTL